MARLDLVSTWEMGVCPPLQPWERDRASQLVGCLDGVLHSGPILPQPSLLRLALSSGPCPTASSSIVSSLSLTSSSISISSVLLLTVMNMKWSNLWWTYTLGRTLPTCLGRATFASLHFCRTDVVGGALCQLLILGVLPCCRPSYFLLPRLR